MHVISRLNTMVSISMYVLTGMVSPAVVLMWQATLKLTLGGSVMVSVLESILEDQPQPLQQHLLQQ